MKNKTPHKGQLWAVGTKVYRIMQVLGETVRVNHHDKVTMFYTRHLKVATPSQVEEYLGK